MKRMLRFGFIVIVMVIYYFAWVFFFSPVLEQLLFENIEIVDEHAMLIFALITQAFAAIIFIVLYVKWYIAVPNHKREFLKQLETREYTVKSDIIYYIEENNGVMDILVYGLYSALLPLSIWVFNEVTPIAFLYFQQLIFYQIRLTGFFAADLVFCYMISVLFFIISYVGGVALLHKRWHKNRLRK